MIQGKLFSGKSNLFSNFSTKIEETSIELFKTDAHTSRDSAVSSLCQGNLRTAILFK